MIACDDTQDAKSTRNLSRTTGSQAISEPGTLARKSHQHSESLRNSQRRATSRAEGVYTGLAFRALNRLHKLLLHAWVTRRLLDEVAHIGSSEAR